MRRPAPRDDAGAPAPRLLNLRSCAGRRELTGGPRDGYASFAPDGRSVVFERSGAVMRVPVGGGRARRLLRGRQPAIGR